jgi:ectoine hydroxylase-related dioxygenase (phytanoyl-CoA dioxygenase family)
MTTLAQSLTKEQRQRFDDRGLVKLEGFVPRKTAEMMADRLWQELARGHKIHRRDRSTWTQERPMDFKALQKSGAFRALATPEVRSLADELIGRGQWVEPPYWGQPLVCFPTQHRWDVPHKNWHLDLPAHPQRFRLPIARFFLLLAPLKRGGGGTLVVTGSHRLVEGLADQAQAELPSSAMRKQLLGQHRWFGELMSQTRDFSRVERFMAAPALVDGVPVQVEEITGEPGDLWLMHAAALHTSSPNNRDEPRLALAQSIFPKAYFA